MPQISITKFTGIREAHRAIQSTIKKDFLPKATLLDVYGWEHSISRTQMFWIEMREVPSFVSVHIIRHKIGVEHFVSSNRIDRGGDEKADRYSPVTHSMLINAEAIIKIARARLCFKASKETRELIYEVKREMGVVDKALADHMLPNCFHQGLICKEPKPCGRYPILKWSNFIHSLPEVQI